MSSAVAPADVVTSDSPDRILGITLIVLERRDGGLGRGEQKVRKMQYRVNHHLTKLGWLNFECGCFITICFIFVTYTVDKTELDQI